LTVAYLSPAWAEEAARLLRASPRIREAASGLELSLLVRLRDPPPGRVGWVFAAFAGDGVADVRHGAPRDDAPDATVALEATYETYAAIRAGELAPRRALLSGQVRLTGNRLTALRHMGALEAIAAALAEIPAAA
jgi:hypothetical protein